MCLKKYCYNSLDMNPDISTRPTFANMLLLEARNFMACGLLIFNIVAFQRMRLSQCNPFASVNKKKSPKNQRMESRILGRPSSVDCNDSMKFCKITSSTRKRIVPMYDTVHKKITNESPSIHRFCS